MQINLENCSYDYLPNKEHIHLYQYKDMFRMNTDSVLLGNFIDLPDKSLVLDIGTNNGVLLLYASCFNYQTLVGIDINDKAIELAKYNLELNHVQNYELYCKDLLDFEYDSLFDVIICNPPYFSNSTKSDNKSLMDAKHDTNLTLENLFDKVNKLLKKDGSFYLIHRLDKLDKINAIINNLNMRIYRKNIVNRKQNKDVVLLEIKYKE